MGTTVEEVIAGHRAAGHLFEAAGLMSFVRAEGEGKPVVLLHGLPSSSFLYRKVIPELAARGFRMGVVAAAAGVPGAQLRRRHQRPVGGPPVEIDAYRDLVVRVDGGAAYLEIMRNLRRGARDHRAAVDSRSAPYPVQVIWGAKDPILPLRRHGWKAMIAAGVPSIRPSRQALPARGSRPPARRADRCLHRPLLAGPPARPGSWRRSTRYGTRAASGSCRRRVRRPCR
jgi:pimeloyl-ACP methyl ester carboxylesterase